MITNKNLFWNITIIVENLKAIKIQLLSKDSKDSEEYATRGPFASIFGGPVARLLDQALIVGNMEQTISILAESTNQSYKTTKAALEKLEKIGFVAQTRKIGNAQAYRFLVENHLNGLLACGVEFQRNRTDI
ncbi:MAG TPA: hypothetical protein VJY36_04120 [Candidatus Bathyarchaeia archaeon]|nr:hypothetical protein [Candidatus Bathyarchaeia archaeon]